MKTHLSTFKIYLYLLIGSFILYFWAVGRTWININEENEHFQEVQINLVANSLHSFLTSKIQLLDLAAGAYQKDNKEFFSGFNSKTYNDILIFDEKGLINPKIKQLKDSFLLNKTIQLTSEQDFVIGEAVYEPTNQILSIPIIKRFTIKGENLTFGLVEHTDIKKIIGYNNTPNKLFISDSSGHLKYIQSRQYLIENESLDICSEYIIKNIKEKINKENSIPFYHYTYKNDHKSTHEKHNNVEEHHTNHKHFFSYEKNIFGFMNDVELTAFKVQDYDFWIVSYIYKKELVADFLQELIYISLFFLTLQIIGHLFLRRINQNENEEKNKIKKKINHDHLTGLLNNKRIQEVFNEWKNKKEFSLFFIDIDKFKHVNDRYGHVIGDAVLKRTASIIQNITYKKGYSFRQSGDEFIILFDSVNKKEIEKVSKKIIKAITSTNLISNYQIEIGCSIGVVFYPEHHTELKTLVHYADAAMYSSKKHGNAYQFFNDNILEKQIKEELIFEKLPNAIESSAVEVYFQPQLDKNKELIGVESLARWSDIGMGFVSPEMFISVAEKRGLMTSLGDYIIEKSFLQFKELFNKGIINEKATISLNISPKQLLEQNFSNKLCYFANKYDIENDTIVLELTENFEFEDILKHKHIFKKLSELGMKISLDDFGTGTSSLSMIGKLPVNEIKIDRSFVEKIMEDEKSAILIKGLIDLTHQMGIVMVAEGIESIEQFKVLKSYNCDFYQGYLFSKPLNMTDFEKFIIKNKKL